MPIYVYKCPKCGKEWERRKPMAEMDDEKCPKCGEPAKRMPTCGSFRITGGTPRFH